MCGQEFSADGAGFYWQSAVVMLGRRGSSGNIHKASVSPRCGRMMVDVKI